MSQKLHNFMCHVHLRRLGRNFRPGQLPALPPLPQPSHEFSFCQAVAYTPPTSDRARPLATRESIPLSSASALPWPPYFPVPTYVHPCGPLPTCVHSAGLSCRICFLGNFQACFLPHRNWEERAELHRVCLSWSAACLGELASVATPMHMPSSLRLQHPACTPSPLSVKVA